MTANSMSCSMKPTPPDPPAIGTTKVRRICGTEITLTLALCRRCDEPTFFAPGVHCCNGCAEEYIDVGPERSPLRLSDYNYQGCVPDRVEAMGLPRPPDGRH